MAVKSLKKRVLFLYGPKKIGLGLLFLSALLASVVLSFAQPAQAATNSTLNFQARLQTNGGGIVPDGYYNVQFKIYDGGTAGGPAGPGALNAGTGSTHLWTESYYDSNGVTAGNDNRIRVKNGYLTANLGSQTVFPSTINWDQELWITMNVGGMTQTATPTYDGEMNPRLKLTGVPYAFRAGSLLQHYDATSAGSASTINLTNGSGTNTNGMLINRNAASGTTTNGLNITNTAGTLTNGIQLTGTMTNLINSSSFVVSGAGAISGITGIAMASGNFGQTGTGTFSTGTGLVSLNGATTVAGELFLQSNLKLTDRTRQWTAAYNTTIAATTPIQMGEMTFSANSQNVFITGEIRGQTGASVAYSRFTIAARADTLPTKTFTFSQEKEGSIDMSAKLYHDATTGRVVVGYQTASALQNVTWTLTTSDRDSTYNFWTPTTTYTTLNTSGLTEITPNTSYARSMGGNLSVDGSVTGLTGATFSGGTVNLNANSAGNTTNIGTGTSTGSTNINNSATAGNINIGGGSNQININTSNIDISTAGVISGATGITMASGNFGQTGTGTFATGTGAVGLNGDTTIAAGKTLAAGGNVNVGSAGDRTGAGRLFSDGFESGNLKLWGSAATTSGSSTLAVDTTIVRNGKYSTKVTNNNGTSYITAPLANGVTTSVRGYVYVASHTTGAADLLSLYGANAFTLHRNISTGKLAFWNSNTATTTDTTGDLTTGAWHQIELLLTLNATTGSATVYLNGVAVLTQTNINTGTGTTNGLTLGDMNGGRNHVVYYDDIAVDYWRPGESANLNVNDSLHIAGTSSFGGVALFQSTTNATNAFSVQNSAGTVNLLNIDTSANAITLGANTAVVGNLEVKDAATATKAYRLRTSGSALDLDAAGASLYLSTFTNANYTGTQYNYLVLDNTQHVASVLGSWQFKQAVGGTVRHIIDGTAGTNVQFNQDGAATDFRIQGDTAGYLFYAQGSSDRVGINNSNPGYTLDVGGTINGTAFRVGGTAGSSTTCSGGQVLQNAVIAGGITTGGTCTANGTGVLSLGAILTSGKGANGGVITGTTLQMQEADASFAGLVSTGTQTFNGAKTFSSGLTSNGTTSVAGTANINTSNNFTTNINTGTTSNSVNIGGDTNTVNIGTSGSATGTTNVYTRFAVGGTTPTTLTATNRAQITGTFATNNASQYGLQNNISFNPQTTAPTDIYGMTSTPSITGSALGITTFTGFSARVSSTTGYTGKITNAVGLEIQGPSLLNGGGAANQYVDDYRGIFVNGFSNNGGNTTGTVNNHQLRFNGITSGAGSGGTVNNYGIYVTQPSGSGGTTNNYGIYITGNGGGTSSYALYNTGTAPIYTQGNLQIGTTSNTNGYALQVAGDINSTTGVYRTGNTTRLDNAGALSNITGYSQSSGNFVQSGSGTFATGTGAVGLNGDTTIAAGKLLNAGGTVNIGSAANRSGAARYFTDGFESNSFNHWAWGTNVSGSSALTIDSTVVKNGKYSAKVVANNGNANANTNFPNTITADVTVRANVYISSHTSGAADIYGIYSDNSYILIYRNQSTGLLHVYRDIGGTVTDQATSATFTTGAWHTVEMVVNKNASTGSITVYYDGVSVYSPTNINTHAEWAYGLIIGSDNSSSAYTAYIDDVVVDSVRPGDSASLNVNDSLHVAGTSSFGGAMLIQPATYTSNALMVRARNGDVLFNVDAESYRVGVGTGSAAQTLSVSGSFGGDQVRDVRNISSSATYTVTDEGLTYYLESNSGTTNSNITSTFNITGLPNVDGTVAFIQLYVSKGNTVGSRWHNVTIQVHGTTLGSIETITQTGSDESYRAFSVARFDGFWMVTGSNPEFQQGFDLAEWIPYTGVKPEAGDLLTIGDNPSAASVKKTTGPQDNRIIGVVTTKPGQVLGKDDGHSVRMALSGRVPVKVSLENGPIEPGDYLTSSSIPGVAMKATQAGKAVGTAFTGYDGSQEEATVIVQVQTGFAVPDGGSATSLQGGSLQGTGVEADQGAGIDGTDAGTDVKIENLQTQVASLQADIASLQSQLSGLGSSINTDSLRTDSLAVRGDAIVEGGLAVKGLAKLASIEISGHIISKGEAPKVELQKAAGLVDANDTYADAKVEITGNDTAGVLTITIGQNPESDQLLKLVFNKPFATAPQVLLTPVGPEAARLQAYIDSPSTTDFILGLIGQPQTGTTYRFNYYVIQ